MADEYSDMVVRYVEERVEVVEAPERLRISLALLMNANAIEVRGTLLLFGKPEQVPYEVEGIETWPSISLLCRRWHSMEFGDAVLSEAATA